MDYSPRMCVGEGLHCPFRDLKTSPDGKCFDRRLIATSDTFEDLKQVLARNTFHDKEQALFRIVSDVIHRYGVGMLKLRRDACFAEQSSTFVAVPTGLEQQRLNRNRSTGDSIVTGAQDRTSAACHLAHSRIASQVAWRRLRQIRISPGENYGGLTHFLIVEKYHTKVEGSIMPKSLDGLRYRSCPTTRKGSHIVLDCGLLFIPIIGIRGLMMSVSPLRGLIAATVTPISQTGDIDLDGIAPVIDRLVSTGIRGLYVCGSTGEGMSLATTERQQVAETSVRAAGGRVPVIVQVGHNSIREARRSPEHASSIGADIISATCPSYFKINDVETLAECMREIASAASNLPFYYYHIPALTGSTIDMTVFLRTASQSIPNFTGVKYTAPLLHEFQSLRGVDDGRFDIVWGCDEMLLGACATGAQAAIGSTYNVAGPLYQQIMEALASGDIDRARKLQSHSVSLVSVLSDYPFHAALKATMEMLGMRVGGCRLPIASLNEQQVKSLQARLDAIGFFKWCGHST